MATPGGTNILMSEADFERTITAMHDKRDLLNASIEDLLKRMDTSMSDYAWKNAKKDTFAACKEKMKAMLEGSSENIYFLTNILRQVKLDFENVDQTLAGNP